MTYKQISMDVAKQIFEADTDASYIILDVMSHFNESVLRYDLYYEE